MTCRRLTRCWRGSLGWWWRGTLRGEACDHGNPHRGGPEPVRFESHDMQIMPRSRPNASSAGYDRSHGSTPAFASSGGSAAAFPVFVAPVSDRDDDCDDCRDVDLSVPSTRGASGTPGTRLDCRWRPPRRRPRGRPTGPVSAPPGMAIGFWEGIDGPPTRATASFGRSSPHISPADAPEGVASPAGSSSASGSSPPAAVRASSPLLARLASRSARRRSRQFSTSGGG